MAKTRKLGDNRYDDILRSKMLSSNSGTGGDASEATLQAILTELGLKADLTEIQPISSTQLTTLLGLVNVTAKYNISREDTSTTTEYYGFLNTDGSWYIMQIDTLTGIYLYINGTVNFLSEWNNRLTLVYDEFDNLTW